LRILHLSTAPTWRGGERQLWLLARELRALGQEQLVLAPPGAPLHERLSAMGVASQPVSARPTWNPFMHWRLRGVIREFRADVVHLHDGHAIRAGSAACRSLKPTPVVIAHRRTAFGLNNPRVYRWPVQGIVAISEAVRECLRDAGLTGQPPDPLIRVVHSSIEALPPPSPEVRASFRAKLGLSEDDCLIVHAAALTAEKRQADLLQAMARLVSMERADSAKGARTPRVFLAIAGEGPLEASLRTTARSLELSERVHFLGFLTDMAPLWAGGDLMVMTSENEGLCTALLEAQAAGLPAVATRVGGMPEVVREGQTGVLVELGDVDGLARALTELARDPDRRGTYGAAASEVIKARFSCNSMARNTLAFYRELRHRVAGAPSADETVPERTAHA
jgi:glycosyltransferase involved in cell wall biosynthesis